MKAFKDFFKYEDIVLYLCRIRAKNAKQRDKKHKIHLLTEHEDFNYHKTDDEKISDYERQFQNDLNKLFPSRRKWKDLGEPSRYKKGTKQKLSSIDKNVYSLLKTIKYYQKEKPIEKFILELNSFVADIQSSIESPEYLISKPVIYPKPKVKKKLSELKEDEKNTCRPIALFTLKDRLILSFTNKYLTQLFDCHFEGCSLAFRAVKKVNGEKEIISHHTAIQEIVEYKNLHKETPLWIAECDMKKFYDSVNHKIIIKQFEILINKVKSDNPGIDITFPERIFYKYLDCYWFNKNVLCYKNDSEYWEKYKIVKGEFGWVAKEFKTLNYYEDIENERIGIPQGGALSGLIANIVLDYADRKVIESGLFYVRFCDDMILMHPNQEKCNSKVKDYQEVLKELLLVPHDFCEEGDLIMARKEKKEKLPIKTLSPFWNEKSKGPYKWCAVDNGGFPWIGFVGYELHYNGFIRVRKASLVKELKKQHEVIKQIRNSIKDNQRVGNGTVIESAINRLIGMSVGRVDLWNYKEIDNEMCWKKGFQELNKNKYSIKQLKELDRNRNKLYYKLIAELYKEVVVEGNEEDRTKPKPRQPFYYNRPFSYYYQIAERTKEKQSNETP